MTTKDQQVATLRKKIAALTGKTPDSDDPRYLAQRLADIERRKAAGHNVRPKRGRSVISVSLHVEAGHAFARMMEREKLGASALVLRALAHYADAKDYKSEAAAMVAT